MSKKEESKTFIHNWLPGRSAENYIVSANTFKP